MMCYGCDLVLKSGDTACDQYLGVRAEYDLLISQFKLLEYRMLELEDEMADPEQRKHWHSVRAKIKQSKTLANVAFNDMIGEKQCT